MTDHQEAPGVPEITDHTAELAPDPTGEVEQAAAALESAEDDPDPRVQKANREAAEYRRKLRVVEQERDELQGRYEKYERGIVEQAAAALGLQSTEDLWLATPDLAVLRGDDGHIDDERVAGHLDEMRKSRPHWFKWVSASQGSKGWSAPSGPVGLPYGAKPSTFADAIKAAH